MVSNEETLEWRDRCDKCDANFGEFHKGCDGRWIKESRTVTAWARTSASAGVGDAGTSTGTPEPSRAATEAHSDDELTGLPEYLDAIRAGSDPTPAPENAWPTAGQLWHWLLEAPVDDRLDRLSACIDAMAQAHWMAMRGDQWKDAALAAEAKAAELRRIIMQGGQDATSVRREAIAALDAE